MPHKKEFDIPRLEDEIKKLNGKSSRQLQEKIDELKKVLEDEKTGRVLRKLSDKKKHK